MMTWTLLLLLGRAYVAPDEIHAEIAVAAEGSPIEIDLAALKGVLPPEQFPKDSSGFLASSKLDNHRVRPEKGGWTLRLPKVSPANGAEIVVAHEGLNLRIVLRVVSAKERLVQAYWTKIAGRESAMCIVVDVGKGGWTSKSDPGLAITTEGEPAVNSVKLSGFSAFVRTGVSCLYLAARGDLAPWTAVAERYYRAIVTGNRKEFVLCYNKYDRRNAGQYATVQLHWRAGQRLVQNRAVVRYEFVRLDERRSTPTRKKLFYRRIGKKGEQVGLPLPIFIENEDGVWVVSGATQ